MLSITVTSLTILLTSCLAQVLLTMTIEPATPALSPFSSLSEILKAPLRIEDLEFDVGDGQYLADFEEAWAIFLRDNPDLAPRGAREERILRLQRDARKEEEEKLKIITEMEQQLEFFKASCEELEEVYSGTWHLEFGEVLSSTSSY
jgi:hypothetical protein